MIFILAHSLVMNLAPAFRINELNKSKRDIPDLTPIQAGTMVSPAKAQDMEGRQVLISYDKVQPPVVLYIFTPQCPWCVQPRKPLSCNARTECWR